MCHNIFAADGLIHSIPSFVKKTSSFRYHAYRSHKVFTLNTLLSNRTSSYSYSSRK